MFERILGIFIFILYLFDTVFAFDEKNNGGKGMEKAFTFKGVVFLESLAMPNLCHLTRLSRRRIISQ
ncbi:unnamed protein product [Haemonchus placei]|uniref:Uncharacterized protein n=1 Tax=Haemonchus placei TaxID=6290 RepID=A0A0N4X7Z3_HAEPC|nr:unnamed protein product [Haemonchus placei]